jgi:hypothetical protein
MRVRDECGEEVSLTDRDTISADGHLEPGVKRSDLNPVVVAGHESSPGFRSNRSQKAAALISKDLDVHDDSLLQVTD